MKGRGGNEKKKKKRALPKRGGKMDGRARF